MTYGTIKVDTVTFTDAGVDKSVTLSGLVQNPVFSGNVTVTGTLSGVTVTGTTANFTSGNFTNISGGTHTITSGVFAAGSAASPSITFTGDLNTGIYSPGADQVAISTGGSGRLFVDASGNVGVGTGGTQGTKLHAVGGNVWSGNFYEVGRFQKSSGTAISLGYDNSDYVATVGAYSHDGTPSNLSFWTYPGSGTIQERLRITSAGLVGVGTSSPMNLFHVSGTASTPALFERTSTTGSFIGLKDSTSYAYIGNTNGVFSIQTPGSSYSDKLVVTSAGLVGIGTSSIRGTSLLDARGDISFGSNASYYGLLSYNAGTGYVETTSSDGGFKWIRASGPVTSMTLDSSGRLGIGTTSPGFKCQVDSPIALSGSGNDYYFVAGNTSSASRRAVALGVDGVGGNAVIAGYNTFSPGLETLIVDGSDIQVRTGSTERARIDSSGRLLVGTSTARSVFNNTTHSALFQIEGASASGGATGRFVSQVFGSSANADPMHILARHRSDSVGGITAVGSGDRLGTLSFQGSDGSEFASAAEITAEVDGTPGANDMPGRLVFSTTADGASSPTERMRISQNGLVTIAGPGGGTFLKLANSGGYDGLHEVDNTAYTIGQNSDVRAMRIGSGANWLTTGVNLAAGGTSWGTYSDERLKTDIVELTGCLDNIKNIRCVSYRLTDVDKTDSKKRLGVIAQDLVGKYDEAVNASRRSEDDETEYLSVQYSDLVPVLLKALQEATAKIETLEARLTAAGI